MPGDPQALTSCHLHVKSTDTELSGALAALLVLSCVHVFLRTEPYWTKDVPLRQLLWLQGLVHVTLAFCSGDVASKDADLAWICNFV